MKSNRWFLLCGLLGCLAGPIWAQRGSVHRSPESAGPVAPVLRLDRLASSESLSAGGTLTSANRAYRFELQHDGNCVIYRMPEHRPTWATGTLIESGARLELSPRGRLSLVASGLGTRWESGPEGPPAEYYLQMQDDGNLVIYRRVEDTFYPHWSSQNEGRKGRLP